MARCKQRSSLLEKNRKDPSGPQFIRGFRPAKSWNTSVQRISMDSIEYSEDRREKGTSSESSKLEFLAKV